MKKIMSVLFVLMCLTSTFSLAAAEDGADITLTFNGAVVPCDVPPQIVNDRTLVPMRAALEALGASILWDESTSTVHAQGPDGTIISLQIGSDKLFTSDEIMIMDVPARIMNDRTMVPIRAVAESLNCEVSWLPDTREVAITKY